MKKICLIIILIPVFMFNSRTGFSQSTTERDALTFMLSNESPGYLIDNLIAAGYRDSSLYTVMQYLQPLSGGAIPQWFMDSLAVCPANSEVFTFGLWRFSDPSNNPIGIAEDGTLVIAAIFGRDFSGKEGYTTYNDTLVPVSLKLFAKAIAPQYYLDAGSNTVQNPSGLVITNYKAFAIAWAMEPPTTFVLTNEGGLIDDLIRAGHGDKNLYQVLEVLKPKSGGVISDEFMAMLANCPAGSEIFTAALNNFSGLNNPVCINSDGTLSINGISGLDYFRKEGYATYPENLTGGGRALFTYAKSPAYYIDAGSRVNQDGKVTEFRAFAIAWSMAPPTTFVLSNEAPGFLIDKLITAGYGNSSLYEVLVALKPESGGVISQEFLDKLAGCPVGSELFATHLTDYTGFNNPVCINTDGIVNILGIFGQDYFGKEGYATFTEEATKLFTYAISPEYYIDAGSSGLEIRYKAFAIAWSNSTDGIPVAETRREAPCAYPNPFTDGFYVQDLPENARLQIFDIRGKLMYQKELKDHSLVQPGTLPGGIYFLKLINSRGIRYQKIVKY